MVGESDGLPSCEKPRKFMGHSLPRRRRIEISGGVDRVLNRGVDRADIVRDDEDRHECFRLLKRVDTRCG